MFDLWIIDGDIGVLIHEMLDECDSGRLAGVPSVGLECKAKDCNFLINGVRSLKKLPWPLYYAYLSGNGLEKSVDHTTGETPLLKFVHLDNLAPVCRYFR